MVVALWHAISRGPSLIFSRLFYHLISRINRYTPAPFIFYILRALNQWIYDAEWNQCRSFDTRSSRMIHADLRGGLTVRDGDGSVGSHPLAEVEWFLAEHLSWQTTTEKAIAVKAPTMLARTCAALLLCVFRGISATLNAPRSSLLLVHFLLVRILWRHVRLVSV